MHEMRVSQITENEILIRLMGENIMEEVKVSMLSPRRDPVQRFLVNGNPMAARISTNKLGYNISWSGCVEDIMVVSPRAAELLRFMPHKMPPDTSKLLQCPMPGLLVSLAVTVGDEVQPGQPLAVVEAMKMENILRAERKGVVQSIKADVGASLSVDQVIMEFE
jgi:propionyl-CoA carboxylase alpha chain